MTAALEFHSIGVAALLHSFWGRLSDLLASILSFSDGKAHYTAPISIFLHSPLSQCQRTWTLFSTSREGLLDTHFVFP
jgi:hypothetical protein